MLPFSSKLPTRTQESLHGVYGIYCKTSGRWYVGSSFYLWRRLCAHRSNLRHGAHHSIILQRSYDKYGEDDFEVDVLEVCTYRELHAQEEHWMTKLQARHPTKGMNIAKPDRHDRTWASKTFRVRKVGDMKWQEVTNLAAWAYAHGFDPSGFFNAAAGKKKTAHGWEVRRLGESEYDWQYRRAEYLESGHVKVRKPRVGVLCRSQIFQITGADGVVHVPSLYQFLVQHSLDKAAVYRALKSGRPFKGYTFKRIS